MYNSSVHSRIELLGQVISDLKEIENELQLASDPSLILDLTEEKSELMEELEVVGTKCMTVIEAYIQDCKDNDFPVCLDYYRVLRELRNSRIY